MEIETNFQVNYQKLLTFLSRKNQKGYIFARADDYRLIAAINKNLAADLSFKGIKANIIFLDESSDVPLLHQVETGFTGAGALIIANLFKIVNDPVSGLSNLTRLNFARETFWEFDKPVLFWADAQSMNIIANHAIDLFSQRRHATVHFDGAESSHTSGLFEREELKPFLSSERFGEIQANIDILERRLADALGVNYHPSRIAVEIALPLAREYAELDLPAEAKRLLNDYETALDSTDDKVLADLARVYYLLHDYKRAIQTLEQANKIIAVTHNGNDGAEIYPQSRLDNLITLAGWQMETGQPEKAIKELQEADVLLGKETELNANRKRTLARIKNDLGDLMIITGELKLARAYYEDGLRIREQLSKSNPLSEQLQRDLSISYNKLGDVERSLGELQKARAYYQDGLKIAEQLIKSNRLSEQLQRDLSISYDRLGDTERSLGELQKARAYYQDGLKIAEQLIKSNPLSEQLQRDLSISYNKLGDIVQSLGELQKARAYYQDGLRIRERLSKNNPLSEQLQRDLSVSYNRLGDIEESLGELQKARAFYLDGLRIAEQLSKSNPLSEQLQRDLSISYEKLGNIEQSLGELEKARAYYQDGLRIREQLSKSNPLSEQLQRDLSVSYDKLGSIEPDAATAIVYYNKSLQLVQKLIAKNPLAKQLKDDKSFYEQKLNELNSKMSQTE